MMKQSLKVESIKLDKSRLKPMHNSDAQGYDLIIDSSGPKKLGIGITYFEKPGHGVDLHTHEGSHILVVTQGRCIVTKHTEEVVVNVGQVYNIESKVPHSVLATKETVLLVIGNDYQSSDSPDRLSGGGSLKDKK